MSEATKQAVTGFRVVSYQVKKVKDGEVVKLLLEADVDAIGAGSYDMGDVLKALLQHQVSDTDVALSVFVQSDD
jgi:uncharacterized protein YqeY